MKKRKGSSEQSIIQQTILFVKSTLDPKPERYDMQYRFEHTMRVAAIGQKIAKAEGIPEEPLVIGCLLHDIGYIKCKKIEDFDIHAVFSEKMAAKYLKSIHYPKEMSESICNAILIHDGGIKRLNHTPTPFELSVMDADDIDRMDAMRLCLTAHSQIGEYSAEEIIQHCKVKKTKLEESLKRVCGTKTADELWKDKITYQLDYFNRLQQQMEQTTILMNE